jgi:hypothetical protein
LRISDIMASTSNLRRGLAGSIPASEEDNLGFAGTAGPGDSENDPGGGTRGRGSLKSTIVKGSYIKWKTLKLEGRKERSCLGREGEKEVQLSQRPVFLSRTSKVKV